MTTQIKNGIDASYLMDDICHVIDHLHDAFDSAAKRADSCHQAADILRRLSRHDRYVADADILTGLRDNILAARSSDLVAMCIDAVRAYRDALAPVAASANWDN